MASYVRWLKEPGLFDQQAELVIFEGCAHAPIYEKVDEFNQATLEFLKRHTG